MFTLPDLALGAVVNLYHRSIGVMDTPDSLEVGYLTLACESRIELDRDTLHTRLGSSHECHSGDGRCAFALVSFMPVGLTLHGLVSVESHRLRLLLLLIRIEARASQLSRRIMEIDSRTADEKLENLNPWRRHRSAGNRSTIVYFEEHSFPLSFDTYDANLFADIDTKRAALRTSSSVVSLISYSGDKKLFCGSGMIIECGEDNGAFASTILTSASLLRSPTNIDETASDVKVTAHLWNGSLNDGQVLGVDLHYNIAVIKIKSVAPLPTAVLRNLDDSVSIYPSDELGFSAKSEKPVLGRHSVKFNLVPGKKVVAVGRYYDAPHELMVAPGEFSIDYCNLDCKELFRANCKNYNASRWWRHFKKHRQSRRPSLGIEVTNLYVARVHILEHIVQNFPDVNKGVIVEKLFKIMWNKSGRSVEVVVIRAMDGAASRLSLPVTISEAERVNRWPLPGKYLSTKRLY
uniref:Uncharacterized protein n=1 Tax=Ananas comosus var. bracteatus TaxID=296719 RepID=A0A6V7NXE3_ANACO|nr:unnamed protein product [Ananas comosus var. bracteatus]